jgi:hypothetical protein
MQAITDLLHRIDTITSSPIALRQRHTDVTQPSEDTVDFCGQCERMLSLARSKPLLPEKKLMSSAPLGLVHFREHFLFECQQGSLV